MCGIVGYIGPAQAAPIILAGLQRLEYRGYDSAGMAVLDDQQTIRIHREEGKLANLAQTLAADPLSGSIAIGHTRWATHGPPVQRNAHPHRSPDGELVLVQNGIVENFLTLRSFLQERGYLFLSDTDTEVIVFLLHHHYHNACTGDLPAAIRQTLLQLEGPSAIVVLSQKHPHQLFAARLGNAGGMAVGHGPDAAYIASDVSAIAQYTQEVLFLESRQVAEVTAHGTTVTDLQGKPITPQPVTIDWNPEAAEKGAYAYYMQKEIFEQAISLTNTLRDRVDFVQEQIQLDGLQMSAAQARRLSRITIVSCGTSYYAGLAGKYMLERIARVPVEVDYASEFRYRQPLIDDTQMVLAITQSGETVDTLAALELAHQEGAFTAAIVNAVGSQATRMCDGVIYMQAGPEIGVASTKAFTASLTDLFMLAIQLGQLRGVLPDAQRAELVRALIHLPNQVGDLLAEAERSQRYQELAVEFAAYANFLYLGRGINYSTAREGALKLKEISYIHAEGYPAGEMKHGPIALLDRVFPAVVIAPQDSVYDKMVSQVEQVKARNARVVAVGHPDDAYLASIADALLPIPRTHELLTPILAVIPLQLFAFHIALERGTDVDQPRNLAKSVTVE